MIKLRPMVFINDYKIMASVSGIDYDNNCVFVKLSPDDKQYTKFHFDDVIFLETINECDVKGNYIYDNLIVKYNEYDNKYFQVKLSRRLCDLHEIGVGNKNDDGKKIFVNFVDWENVIGLGHIYYYDDCAKGTSEDHKETEMFEQSLDGYTKEYKQIRKEIENKPGWVKEYYNHVVGSGKHCRKFEV